MAEPATITVRVQPKSSRNAIERREDGWRIYVTAPPIDGLANQAVVKLIAKKLGIAPSKVDLVSGDSGRTKKFTIEGLDQEAVDARLASD